MMHVLGAIGLFVSRALWSLTGVSWAGRALVRALGSRHEDVRAIAGVFLVQAGRKSEPLLEEALERRENLPLVLTILGDLRDPTLEPRIREFSYDHDPRVAKAAKDALRVLSFDERKA